MEQNVYSIYDAAAQAFTPPFYMQNDGLAIRAFMDNVNAEEKNNISEHPDQFTLFKIAEFDDKTGTFKDLETNKSLGLGITFKEQKHVDTKQIDAFAAQLKELTQSVNVLTSNNIHNIESAKIQEKLK